MKNQIFHFPVIDIKSSEISDTQIEGNFLKQVSILISSNEKTNDNIQLLRNILKAIHLNYEEDIHLIQIEDHTDYMLNAYIHKYSPKHIILFGLKPNSLGLNMDIVLYRLTNINNAQWLFADPLNDISVNKSLKKALWEALQLLNM